MIEDDRELRVLIRRVADQVIRRLLEPEKAVAGALVLVPSYVPDAKPLKEYLLQRYTDGVTAAGEGAAALEGFKTQAIEAQHDKQLLMSSLKGYADVLLIDPPLWMLKNIAAGDDRGICEQAFMRALLWKKNVSVVLDFERPKFSRGTFFEGINDALKAIEDMGANIVSLKLSAGKPEGRLELVTEAEIEDALRQGRERVVCAPGAIVTPLARDAAKELGIVIEE